MVDAFTNNQMRSLNNAIQASRVSTSENIPKNYANVDARINQIIQAKLQMVGFQKEANAIGKELNMYDAGTKLSDQWAQMAS